MRVAIPLADHRVAPILDNAVSIMIVDLGGSGCAHFFETPVRGWSQRERADELAAFSVEIVVCDRVSRALGGMILERGIELVQHVSGNVDEIVETHRGSQQRDPGFPNLNSAVGAAPQ